MPVDNALIEALLTPISEEHPAGKNLRYDPRFDQVKEARREDLELPEGGLASDRKLADWNQTVKLARALLESETKDLQLAAWMTEGLTRQQGLVGLATGAEVIRGFLGQFWETCFPEYDEDDLELRAGPLEWLGTKFAIPVRQLPVAPGGASLLDQEISRSVPTQAEADGDKEKRTARATALAEGKLAPETVGAQVAEAPKAYYKVLVADATAAAGALAALETESDARFGSDAPSLRLVRTAVEDVRRFAAAVLAEKLIADPDPIEEVAAEGEEGGVAGAVDGVLAVEPVSAADAAARVAGAAKYLRKLDPTNPAPYLMLRGLRWGELRASAAKEFDPKLLDAPPTALRARLRNLLLDGKWPELLEQCEGVMGTSQGRGWLDLQRYAITACERLGSAYDAVAHGIRDELRLLLATVPHLPLMTLMDDVPTANPETLTWLTAERLIGPLSQLGPEAGTDARVAPEPAAALGEALTQERATGEFGGIRARGARAPERDPFLLARAAIANGQSHRAIELLINEAARERSARGRFVRQVQVAWAMVECGMDPIARPILDRLMATIDERRLDEWEAGPLVAEPMALICRILDRAGNSGSSDRAGLYLRICRLDPLQAIALQQP